MGIQKRLQYVVFIIFLTVLGGSLGYYALFQGQPAFLDCVYMTVISLTSVGYGEVLEVTGNPYAEVFTMFLITFGLGIIMYGISTLTAVIVEGEFSGILRRKSMEKRIARLNNHYIVCGGGQTGRHVIAELTKNNEKVVFIEMDPGKISQCQAMVEDLLYIEGDATDDKNLLLAGIERALGIIIALPNNKDNLYVTMTARMLNANIRIISRMVDSSVEPKLRKAGANSVVSPNFIGGMRMASEMIRPAAVSFLDRMLRTGDRTLRIHEVTISGNSPLVGKTIRSAGLKDKYGLLVLGARADDGYDIIFNPHAAMELTPGATLVVMGEVESIAKVRELA
ncbi:MAG: potassium channel protein [Desulfatibacillum sp.]|nr:potassium channel protein [Desulfatibacillum sp.]